MAMLTVTADPDSYISGVQNNLNFGAGVFIAHDVLYLAGDKIQWRRGIGNFDVSAIAGATINSAKLVREITQLSNGGQDAILSRCTRPTDWVESEVTWDDYKTSIPWTDAGGDFDDTGPPAKITYTEPSTTGSFDVTGLKGFVEDALDNRSGIVSIITRLVDEDPSVDTQYAWRSKEYGSDIWHLIVDYTPAPSLVERGFERGVGRGVLRGAT